MLLCLLAVCAPAFGGCQSVRHGTGPSTPSADPEEQISAYRIRSGFEWPLNADAGWAAPANAEAVVDVDSPFRLRLQLSSGDGPDSLRYYLLQARHNDGPWETVVAADFPYPAYASPPVSIISPPYPAGTHTEDLIPQSGLEHGEDGRGLGLSPLSFGAGEYGVAAEWEWPLVIRRYADGPVLVEDGDRFEFRLADLRGRLLGQPVTPAIVARVPDGHLGGTFVESPGRIGPWQAANGDLYFIMEPTETDNRFMIVRSTDDGRTWSEVDGPNRPPARDLEAVDAARVDATIHILHQEDKVWYHAFNTADHPDQPDRWVVRSEPVASPDDPPVQSVGLAARPDGSLVAFHAAGPGIHFRVRRTDGSWSGPTALPESRRASGIQVATDAAGTIHLVYTREDGTGWTRSLRQDNTFGPARLLSKNIGRTEADIGSILPPVILPETGEVVFVYREADGRLHERRLKADRGGLTPPIRITARPVVQNAVDSDQTGADLVAANGRLYLFFIDEETRDLLYSFKDPEGPWTQPQSLAVGINAAWIRAMPTGDGEIAFVYDAGSLGGSGMNRFGSLKIE